MLTGFPLWVHSQGTRVRTAPGVPRAGGVAGALGVSPVAVVRLTSYLHEFFVLQKITFLLHEQLLVLSSFPHSLMMQDEGNMHMSCPWEG